jgi:hypothetical protein
VIAFLGERRYAADAMALVDEFIKNGKRTTTW